MPQGASGDLVRLILVGAMGVAAVVVAFTTGIPGNGVFLVVAWLAGFAAVLVRPGWGGFLTLASAIAVTAVIADMSDGVSGLVVLVVASLLVPAAHGALVGYIARRMVSLGPAKSIRSHHPLINGAASSVRSTHRGSGLRHSSGRVPSELEPHKAPGATWSPAFLLGVGARRWGGAPGASAYAASERARLPSLGPSTPHRALRSLRWKGIAPGVRGRSCPRRPVLQARGRRRQRIHTRERGGPS
jgi:hypothetical protein